MSLDQVYEVVGQIRAVVAELEQYHTARYKPDMSKKSGPSKSYKQRVKDGLTPVFVWLTPEAAAALEGAMAASGGTKTSVIEELLLASARPRVVERVVERQPDTPKPKPKATPISAPALSGVRRQATIVSTGAIASDGRIRAAR